MNATSPVNPSSLVKALYTKGSSLFVNLRGTWYEFFNKADHAEALTNAESAGKYFNSEVWSDLPSEYRIAESPAQ